jgi:hypothetical protein
MAELMYYTGIGSQETPEDICQLMTEIAVKLRSLGYWLRSGGAKRADSAFERGADHACDIFLPWQGFNGNASPLYRHCDGARAIAERYHPAWPRLTGYQKKFHTRNVYQVLGATLDKSSHFLVCWTKDGRATGGTGQAMRIARAYNVPIFNLRIDGDYRALINFVENGLDTRAQFII